MPKKVLTQQDLDLNPELAEQGLKVGDEVDIPEGENVTSPQSLNDEPPPPPPTGEHPKKPGNP